MARLDGELKSAWGYSTVIDEAFGDGGNNEWQWFRTKSVICTIGRGEKTLPS